MLGGREFAQTVDKVHEHSPRLRFGVRYLGVLRRQMVRMVPANEFNQDLGCVETVVTSLVGWFIDRIT